MPKLGQGLLFSLHLLGCPTLMPQGCIFLYFLNKLSCKMGLYYCPYEGYNTGPSVTSNFCCDETKPRKLQTPPTLLRSYCFVLGPSVCETGRHPEEWILCFPQSCRDPAIDLHWPSEPFALGSPPNVRSSGLGA